MADKVVLVMAEADGRPVGGALNLKGDDTLYGRYWGCLESHAFLHFEACYYQAIDYAIAHGLQRVEAGAQGDHKIQRGYVPVPTYSAHWVVDPAFRRAIEDYLKRERPAVEQEIEGLKQYSPFRKENDSLGRCGRVPSYTSLTIAPSAHCQLQCVRFVVDDSTDAEQKEPNVKTPNLKAQFAFLVAGLSLAMPALGQSPDAKYCADLKDKFEQYVSDWKRKRFGRNVARCRDREGQVQFGPGVGHPGVREGAEGSSDHLAAPQLSDAAGPLGNRRTCGQGLEPVEQRLLTWINLLTRRLQREPSRPVDFGE